eukprot:Phypoly_transcript_06874.p1 GENE.Phypoly_transcript_06874~~Phypoly_transcript_06874.p1  ORF type:complete len:515 (+),score=65.89 Phypoly_transcript_06874:128-1672(+)
MLHHQQHNSKEEEGQEMAVISLGDDPPKENKKTEKKDSKVALLSDTEVATNIPCRLDNLPWSGWHWVVILALGISWVLDGFEVTIVGVINGVLQDQRTLGLNETQIGFTGTIYILGCICGAIIFGFLADRYGRQKLFIATPIVYLTATLLTGLSWNFQTFSICQFVKGLGIGGEYSAMNSAINEMIPARVRGWVDLAVNGSYWIGAVLAAAVSIGLLDTSKFRIDIGWRLPFAIGGALGIIIIILRLKFIPESPRWLIIHERVTEAEEIVANIEKKVYKNQTIPEVNQYVTVNKKTASMVDIMKTVLTKKYFKRSTVGLALMVAQAFFYNAIFFGYALILTNFYAVDPADVGLYLIPFAIGNFLGGIIIGRFFDTVGRKKMIFITYVGSGALLAGTAVLFYYDKLNAFTQTLAWSVIFFFASAGASSAYLTISEIFPSEVRAMAISLFYALGTGVGGLIGPALFGILIHSASRMNLMVGYFLGSSLMFLAAVVELAWGIDTEGKSLEEIEAAEN